MNKIKTIIASIIVLAVILSTTLAFNAKAEDLSIPDYTISTSQGVTFGKITSIPYVIENNTGQSTEAVLVSSLYSDDKLIKTNSKDITINETEDTLGSVTFEEIEDPDGDYKVIVSLNKDSQGSTPPLVPDIDIPVVQDSREYQLKDITSVNIMEEKDGAFLKVTDLINEQKEKYIAEVTFKDQPVLYTTVLNISTTAENKTEVTLDFDNLANAKIQYPYTPLQTRQTAEEGYIPDYEKVTDMDGYDPEKNILYSNLNKLAPFYNMSTLIKDGAKIDKEHEWNKKHIKEIFPLIDGVFHAELTKQNQADFDEILIVYEDLTNAKFQISYLLNQSNIANYKIANIPAYFLPNRYPTDEEAAVISEMKAKISSYDYMTTAMKYVSDSRTPSTLIWDELMIPTQKSETILLGESFGETKNDPLPFLTKLMSADSKLNVYQESPIIQKYIKSKFMDAKQYDWDSVLYSYSYFDKWYSIDFDAVNLRDAMFFRGSFYGKGLTPTTLSASITGNKVKNQHRGTLTDQMFDNAIKPKLYFNSLPNAENLPSGKKNSVGEFIEYNAAIFENIHDGNEWFVNHFNGVLIERTDSRYPDVDYRAWDSIKWNTTEVWLGGSIITGFKSSFVLPLLEYNGTDVYMMSIPTELFIGPISCYNKNPDNETDRNWVRQQLNSIADTMIPYWMTPASFIPDATTYLNNMKHMAIDSALGYTINEKCPIPIYKTFYRSMRLWPPVANNAAVNRNGTIFFNQHSLLTAGSDHVHEAAHSERYYFFENKGHRKFAFGEDYAGSLFESSPNSDSVSVNFIKNSTPFENGTGNMRLDSIEGKDNDGNFKIQKFYERYYDAMYALDLLQARAVVKLPKETQRNVILKHNYKWLDYTGVIPGVPGLTSRPDTVAQVHELRAGSEYKKMTVEEFNAIELNSYQDFIDNYLVLSGSLTDGTVVQVQKYGGYGILSSAFVVPYNPQGRPDMYTLKRMSLEFLGEKGWHDGLVQYASSPYEDDLSALRGIMNDPDITYEEWTTGRYNEVNEKINELGIVGIDADKIVELYRLAYENDASGKTGGKMVNNLRSALFKNFIRSTEDFSRDIFTKDGVKEISTPQEFITKIKANPMGIYKLTNDLDFSEIEMPNSSVVGGGFAGYLDGNGHKISNITKPLFSNVNYGKIQNLVIDKANINTPTASPTGMIAPTSISSIFQDVHATGAIYGKLQVGGLIGNDNSSIFSGVSVNAQIRADQWETGGIVGKGLKTMINDSYAQGTLTASGTACGGLIGNGLGVYINHCYTAVTIEQKNSSTFSGGLIGKSDNFDGKNLLNVNIRNSFAIGSGTNMRKFDGQTASNNIIAWYSNNYEYEGAAGSSHTIDSAMNGKIDSMTGETMRNKNFYATTLGFNAEIWDYTKVETGVMPKLRSNDPNNTSLPSEKPIVEINTVEDLAKIRTDPGGKFKLTADLDLSSVAQKTPVLDITFNGILDGNKKTITGLKQPLFNTVGGKISNLALKDSEITIKGTVSSTGALAKSARNADISNVELDNININSWDKIAGLFGEAYNSKISGITAKNINITFTRSHPTAAIIGGLIAYTENCTLENIYINGNISGSDASKAAIIGGAVGVVSGRTIVQNIYAEVNINSEISTITGGLVGKINAANSGSVVRNCISIGNMGDTQNKITGNFGTDNFAPLFQNTYEYAIAIGVPNSTGVFEEKIKVATEENIKDKDFYLNLLKWSEKTWNFDDVSATGAPTLK